MSKNECRTAYIIVDGDMRGGNGVIFRRKIPFSERKITTLQISLESYGFQ